MKTRNLIFGITALALVGTLTVTSCKKKTTDSTTTTADSDNSTNSAIDNTLAENSVNDVTNIGSQASESGGASLSGYRTENSSNILNSCATITYSASAKTFTVDFGTTGCVGSDGRTRTGKLIYNFSASTGTATAYRHPGFACSVSSSNYVVDSYSVNIVNKTISNTTPVGFNSATTNLTWNITANVQVIKPSGGGTITWNGSHTKTLLNTSDPAVYANASTPIAWTLAKIQLNGSASGTNAAGESFTSSSSNIVKDFTCHPYTAQPKRSPFISGTVTHTHGSHAARTIDFGNGTCDYAATITIKGVSYPFNIP